jgi:outer membrane lipoprotein-sorting protein
MKKYLLIFLFFFYSSSFASVKENIINNLNDINNLSFNFEQNINGKIEKGYCSLKYQKKIFCKYNLANNKIMVADGKNMVIKTESSYYLYPIDKTPLNLILDKKFILDKIKISDEIVIENKFINYKFYQNDNEINVYFDKATYDLVGWQTVDIYQNISITYLSSIRKNQKLKKELFLLPKQN